MSDKPPLYSVTQSAFVPDRLDGLADWERRLLAKVGQLRADNKRVILMVDGSRIFVYSAEPRGTIALD